MQPIPSTSPTPAQLHEGQLADFKQLLEAMRGSKRALSDFAQTLIKPSAFSPLYRANETGQRALQELVEDADYLAFCEARNVSPHSLIVTATERSFIYEASSQDGAEKTELLLSANWRWQALRTRIETSVLLLSGQIRGDGLVSAPRMATFYALGPWDPAVPAQHQSAIDTLREKTASFQLGLEEDFDPLDLLPNLATDNQQSIFWGAPTADTQEELRRQFVTGEIKKVIQTFLPEGVTSSLTHLAGGILESVDLERVRAQPTAFLKKILQSAEGIKLGERLLSALQWYGGKPGEKTAPHIRDKVLARALQIWVQGRTLEYSDRIAGYALDVRSNWGRSYQAIWSDFQNHLLTSALANSEKEAIVLARLFLCQFPTEFQVRDIPTDLPCRGSIVWVNFVTGVNLVEATEPDALIRMTFQQLVDLPLQTVVGASPETLRRVARARLAPAVAWALSQGVLAYKDDDNYSRAELERAFETLDRHTQEVTTAVTQLSEPVPQRFELAQAHIDRIFGPGSFSSDGRKLTAASSGTSSTWRSTPPAPRYYSFVDVYAFNQFKGQKTWSITASDGRTETSQQIRIMKDQRINVSPPWRLYGPRFGVDPSTTLPDIEMQFNSAFNKYVQMTKEAYAMFLGSLLASLPWAERQALEFGRVKVYTLRKRTFQVEAKHETPEITMPLRARSGLLLQTTYRGVTRLIELIPQAGVIRPVANLHRDQFGGVIKRENWPIGTNSRWVDVLRHQTLPFDWEAHFSGTEPAALASCEAIVEQLGPTLSAPDKATESVPLTITSARCKEISDFIATRLPLTDEATLRAAGYGMTKFEREAASRERLVNFIKPFVPFWKSIEDITSDDTKRKVEGAFGLSIDLVGFVAPIGKLASGSARLIRNAERLTVSARLPLLATTLKEVAILSVQSLNPFAILVPLSKRLKRLFRAKGSVGKADKFVNSLPQVDNPDAWRPLVSGDRLATVRGLDDVPVRSLSFDGNGNFRLIDPVTSLPYGPSLSSVSGEFSLGRSYYTPLQKYRGHVTVEVPARTRVREVLEVDGRTTFFLDDVPYRLDGDTLRRLSNLDASKRLKAIPCRIRRAPGDLCKSSYVLTDNPAPRPEAGTVITEKHWAEWFGDATFHPSTPKSADDLSLLAYEGKIYQLKDGKLNTYKGRPEWIGLKNRIPVPRETVAAVLEYQTGIYGSLKVTGTAELIDDIHVVGAIIVPSLDGKSRYIFAKLNVNDYYMTSLPISESILTPLKMKKLSPPELADGTAGQELMRVYSGSLNANNTARIYGRGPLEQALDKMDEIAIPIGAPKNPPDNMKHLKLETYSAEAVMFDQKTRLMVSDLSDGAALWTRSSQAPEALQKSAVATLDALFTNQASRVSGRRIATIEQALDELRRLPGQSAGQTRNLAYASLKNSAGLEEVYVSVSGVGDNTRNLPLFQQGSLSLPIVDFDGKTYFNVDALAMPRTPASLHLSNDGKLLSIPHLSDDASNVDRISRITSADSESKLVGFINDKYPNADDIKSITVVTALPPCDSCSIIMKEFGHERGANALNVIWGRRPGLGKRPARPSSSSGSSSRGSSTETETSSSTPSSS